jgi:hypothetical protein
MWIGSQLLTTQIRRHQWLRTPIPRQTYADSQMTGCWSVPFSTLVSQLRA